MKWHTVSAIAALLLASVAIGAPPGPPVTRSFTWTVGSAPCPSGTGTCYGYNGTVPGPTLDINVGDTVQLTIVNNASWPVSFHVHGMVLSAASDGVAAHAGTQLIDSTTPPNGSFTYVFRAANAGVWHYHDHARGFDGAAGVRDGLFGTVIVRNDADVRPTTVIDAHLLDHGAAAADTSVVANVATGAPFELDVTALGNELWTVSGTAPGGGAIAPDATLGPALSHGYVIPAAATGTYRWTATPWYGWGDATTIEVVAS